MPIDYAEIREGATEAITEAGQTGLIKRTAFVPGEPLAPSTAIATSYPCTFVVTEYSQIERSGTLVHQKDKRVLIAATGLAIEPNTGDELVVGGVAHPIVNVSPLSPAGTVVMYEAQVRF